MNKKKNVSKDILTAQESQNIDLAEKGIASSLNPTGNKMPADTKDQKTVLSHISPKRKKVENKQTA